MKRDPLRPSLFEETDHLAIPGPGPSTRQLTPTIPVAIRLLSRPRSAILIGPAAVGGERVEGGGAASWPAPAPESPGPGSSSRPGSCSSSPGGGIRTRLSLGGDPQSVAGGAGT